MIFQPPRIHLFQGYGVELEYMIVDRDTLAVRPLADELIKYETGKYESDFVNGTVTWSNELVLHVLELKSTRPETSIPLLEQTFTENIQSINAILTRWNAMLLPTGAHPFMNPEQESKLWPHDQHEVYAIYDKIFDCKGHGWSNLQSTHLNLPFYDDEEFARLHAAVRILLPILPALCGSTPILNGRFTGAYDTRLKYYKTNQVRIPSITGRVIPEAVFSRRNYMQTIYDRIKADIAPYDPKQILQPIWVNSRGAIARFDRGSLEIRIMDSQECPHADMAILTIVIETVKALVKENFLPHEMQLAWKTEPLVNILDKCIEKGMDAVIDDADYLKVFTIAGARLSARELWQHILTHLPPSLNKWSPVYGTIFTKGNLAQRIITSMKDNYSHQNIVDVYRTLANCLAENKIFAG
jgi:carboxylate-amine ligase